jgi:medium-chain acyl-[acyl-carrier-protein] hydrolase
VLSYELVNELVRRGRPAPDRMIVSGCGAPHLSDDEEPRHLMADNQLMQALRTLEGTPSDILDNRELMALLLPTLRADFELAETYTCLQRTIVPCPISAYGGMNDTKVPQNHLRAWQEYTNEPLTLQMFPGGHFFLHSAQRSLLEALLRDIAKMSP